MGNKLGWLGERFCLLCAVLFSGLILIQSLKAAAALPVLPLAGALWALAVVWLGWNFWKPGERGTAAALFLLRFALAMLVILLVGAQPVQDFQTMYAAAQEMARGGRGYLDSVYFFNWAYQTGFAFYESLPLRLFGPGQLSLQVMNALWLGGIGSLTYLIARRLLPARTAAAASILYAVYPAPYFLSAVLTNQHIAAFFCYLAVYLLVRREELTLPRAALAGAVIAIGNVMRPIGIIVVLAALCWLLVRLLLEKKRRWRRELGNMALLCGGYAVVFALVSGAVVWSGLNPQGLSNNQPMWKFVLGLNQDSNGGWNRSDYETYLSLPTKEADAAMRSVVRERLGAGPGKLAGLALRKSVVMWGDNEYMFWGFGHLDGQKKLGPLTADQWTQVLARGDKGVYLVAFALALLGALALLRRGTRGRGELLLAFLLCGYYAVHLIVEVQARYRYFLMPTVFLLSGFGLAAFTRERAGKKG